MLSTVIVLIAAASVIAQPDPVKQSASGAGGAQETAAPTSGWQKVGPYRVEATFAVGGEGMWDFITIDPESKRLYVPRSTHVMVLDATNGKTLGDIPDTAGVHGVALAPELGRGFSSNGKAGTVTVFDTRTFKVLRTVAAGKNPDAILYEPTTKRVLAFNGGSKNATVIGAEDGKVTGTIVLGGKPECAVADGMGKVYVNMEDTSEIVRLDPKGMKVEERWKLAPGEEPSGLAIDAMHHRLFAACSNEKMVVVDATSGKVLASPTIGKGVDGAAFDPAGEMGGFALASNGEGTLSIISTKDGKFEVAQTLATAVRARTLTIDPKTRRIYLPTAEFETPKEPARTGQRQRPPMKAGTFKIIVVAPLP